MSARSGDWRSGLELLETRVASLPEMLRRLAALDNPALPIRPAKVRRFVTTGLGSSTAHARFLAFVIGESLGLTARYAPLSSLAAPPASAGQDVLIVFSQGLTPNVRPVLGTAPLWQHVVTVTAVRESGDDVKSQVLRDLRAAGGSVRTMPGEDEYGTLVRVVGPMLGYLEAIRLAAAIARATASAPPPIVDVDELCERVRGAGDALDRALDRAALRSLDGLQQGLALLALGDYGTLATNLQYKILEGMLLPLPPVWDLLEFAHGPLQQGFSGPLTLLALSHAGDGVERGLLDRVAATLEPSRHRIIELPAALPGPLAIFEHEAMLDRLMLRWIAERQLDQTNWPARGRDQALYDAQDWQAWLDGSAPLRPFEGSLDTLTSPELEAMVTSGRTTAVLPLGSTEQHGGHLPLATDTRIGDALAERFCQRIPEAIRLPTLPVGCSSEHLGFSGTLSLSSATFAAVLNELVTSLAACGFRRVFLFSAHGGNFAALAEALPDIRASAAGIDVAAFTDLARLTSVLQRESAGCGISAQAAGHHAGEVETSIVLGLDSACVRRGSLAAGFVEPTDDPQSLFYPRLQLRASSGVVGDPTLANAARGLCYLERWTDILVAAYRGEKNFMYANGTQKP